VTVKLGDSNTDVSHVRELVRVVRPEVGDGADFDEELADAVREFQRLKALEPTGEVDDATMDALVAAAEEVQRAVATTAGDTSDLELSDQLAFDGRYVWYWFRSPARALAAESHWAFASLRPEGTSEMGMGGWYPTQAVAAGEFGAAYLDYGGPLPDGRYELGVVVDRDAGGPNRIFAIVVESGQFTFA
jgi:hypothetical protein